MPGFRCLDANFCGFREKSAGSGCFPRGREEGTSVFITFRIHSLLWSSNTAEPAGVTWRSDRHLRLILATNFPFTSIGTKYSGQNISTPTVTPRALHTPFPASPSSSFDYQRISQLHFKPERTEPHSHLPSAIPRRMQPNETFNRRRPILLPFLILSRPRYGLSPDQFLFSNDSAMAEHLTEHFSHSAFYRGILLWTQGQRCQYQGDTQQPVVHTGKDLPRVVYFLTRGRHGGWGASR
jgi:hypothetical protein